MHFSSKWGHLNDLHLADPSYGRPGRVDVLLGVDIYADVLLHGRRSGPPNTPVAFEMKFEWVLAGKTGDLTITSTTTSHHVATISGDDVLRKFWEIEDTTPQSNLLLFIRFVVPLPKMTCVTFGVSASSFAANMSVKQNALDHAMEYPLVRTRHSMLMMG